MSIDAKDRKHVANLRSQASKEGKQLLLDLFCGAGGCTAGYMRAGFICVGVDVNPMPRYPGSHFIQMSAIDCDYEFLELFDIIHASPPCQAFSVGSVPARAAGKVYENLIPPTRLLLVAADKPYIMENVRPAPVRPDICLDGSMFDLGVIRARVFETNIKGLPSYARPSQIEGSVLDGDYVTVAGSGGKGSGRKADWAKAMGIDWMLKRELREAIPPAYTEWIGNEILKQGELLRLKAAPSLTNEPIPDEAIPFGVTMLMPGFSVKDIGA